jgi:hypothetical protein
MKFKAVEPDENFSLLRLVSEGGKWELGLRPMLFGVRVSLGRVWAVGLVVDYCAGAKVADQFGVLAVVLDILEHFPEEASERDALGFFPEQRIRPMYNDPECWAKLLALKDV